MAARKPVAEAGPLPTLAQFNEWVAQQQKLNPGFLPPNQLTQEDIDEWEDACEKLAKAKSKEILLRLKIFKHFFTKPVEGTNNVKLPDGRLVKATYKIDRKVDEAALAALKAYTVGQMRGFFEQLKIDVTKYPDDAKVTDVLRLSTDKLIKYDPELSITEYRQLTAEQAAVFETCLVIKPSESPQLKIETPKAGE